VFAPLGTHPSSAPAVLISELPVLRYRAISAECGSGSGGGDRPTERKLVTYPNAPQDRASAHPPISACSHTRSHHPEGKGVEAPHAGREGEVREQRRRTSGRVTTRASWCSCARWWRRRRRRTALRSGTRCGTRCSPSSRRCSSTSSRWAPCSRPQAGARPTTPRFGRVGFRATMYCKTNPCKTQGVLHRFLALSLTLEFYTAKALLGPDRPRGLAKRGGLCDNIYERNQMLVSGGR
jgi:hypothetical protein